MDVRYIATTSDKLSELAIVNGQLIYLSDINATYYDMGNNRRSISSMKTVSALPSTSTAQEGIIYGVVNSDGFVDAAIWDASASTYRQMTGYVATTSTLGLVKPDGTTITIDSNGVISCHAEITSLPASSITYDNTVSGLSATCVQDAISELTTISSDAAASATSALSQAEASATIAANCSTLAAAASTAAQEALDISAQTATVVQSYESRISALEDIAVIALTIESLPSTYSS